MNQLARTAIKTDFDNICAEDPFLKKQDLRIERNIKFHVKFLLLQNAILYTYLRAQEALIVTSTIGFVSLYIMIEFKKSQLKYIGGYICVFISILEGLFFEKTEMNTMSNIEAFSISIPSIQFVALMQTNINWKLKTYFYAFARLLLMAILYYKAGGMSQIYVLSQIVPVVLNCLLLRDFEVNLLEIYHMNLFNIQEKTKWLSILDNLPFFIVIYNKIQGKITFYNQGIKKLFNTTFNGNKVLENLFSQELTIKMKKDGFHKDKFCEKTNYGSLENLIKSVIDPNKICRLQLKIKEWKRHAMFIGDNISNEETIAIMIDVTRQKHLEHQQLSQKMSTVLYQSLTHKFVTPLNSINTLLQVISRQIPPQICDINQNMKACKESVNTLYQLIHNLNDMSLYKNQILSFENESFELRELVEEIGNQQDNSSRLMKIVIQDTGCGMTEQQLARVFKLLQNLKQIDDVNQHGMGLGLSLCKKIVKAAGGQISCLSKVDEGTQFTIEIPYFIVPDPVTEENPEIYGFKDFPNVKKKHLNDYFINQNYQIKPKPLSSLNESKPTKVLLVDDDAFNLFSLDQLITQRGNFKCDKAKNGQEAINQVIQQYQENKEDMYKYIFIDLNMPILDGKRATITLRQLHDQGVIDLGDTKIFMHSAIQNTVSDDRKIFDGICKPIHFKQLDEILGITQYKRN
eukprot:403354236